MEDRIANLKLAQLTDRYERYLSEEEAIRRKLQNGNIPPGKKEKLTWRLQDLTIRLIPELSVQIQRIQ